jgi:transposase
VCLRFVFLLASRVIAAARLSRRDTAWRTAEILLLQHQLTVLQRQFGERARPTITWADRALIALLLGPIPRARHARTSLIVTPGTILRWRRDLLRRHWARKSMPKGRPPTRRNIRALVLRMAGENDAWGYRRIAGELAGLGIKVAPSTVWAILKKAGIDPAPGRTGPTWADFLIRRKPDARPDRHRPVRRLDLATTDRPKAQTAPNRTDRDRHGSVRCARPVAPVPSGRHQHPLSDREHRRGLFRVPDGASSSMRPWPTGFRAGGAGFRTRSNFDLRLNRSADPC